MHPTLPALPVPFRRFAAMALLASVAGLLASCASPRAASATANPGVAALDRLQTHMTGHFSSAAQHAVDPENFFDISLRMAPIWPAHTTPESRWIYVEQAAAETLDRPYRQRVYRVRTGESATLVSEVYELPGDRGAVLGWAGAWKEPARFDALTPEQLIRRAGCDVVLREIAPGIFEGGTVGNGCESSLRGSAYAISTAHIDAAGLVTWDKGMDKDGKQVWGAEKGGYDFKRVAD
jgi:hypothetical protein